MRVRVAGLLCVHSSFLLVRHQKDGGVYWLLPGGSVHVGERLIGALERELREELRLDCTVGDMEFVVETVSSQGRHIIQPTFRIEARDISTMRIGDDRRVTGFAFVDSKRLDEIVIYPDIREELKEFLKNRGVKRKYIYKKWLE